MYSIYKITCQKNNRVYIGSTTNLKERWQTHKRELNQNIHYNALLQNDWNVYGEEAFLFELIFTGEDDNRYIYEQKEIERYDRCILYNVISAHLVKPVCINKNIECVETGVIYKTASEAGRAMNIDISTICKACKGTRKHAGGYHWRYC